MTLSEALEAISRHEDFDHYQKRVQKLKKLSSERYDLEDAIEVLGEDPRAEKKRQRLAKVLRMIDELK